MEHLWIERILAGETHLFDSLITPYVDTLRRTIFGRVRNCTDADDLLQRSLWKVFRHLVQFRRDSRFRAWLISFGLNEGRQHWREQQRRGRRIDPDIDTFTIPVPDCQQTAVALSLSERAASSRLHRGANSFLAACGHFNLLDSKQ